MEEVVSERRKTFAAAHRSDINRQVYSSASRRASSVIAKAKAEAWQTTYSSLFSKSKPKSVYYLLSSVAGFSSSSPNFPQLFLSQGIGLGFCQLPEISLFYLSAKDPAWQSPRLPFGAMCPEKSHFSFCSPFSPAEFLAAASNLSSSTATGPNKVAYPMLKPFPRSGMEFLLHIFNLSWTLYFFLSIWKTFSIIPIHKMGKPLDSPASFRPISLTSWVSKHFDRIILSRPHFFLDFNSILFSRLAGFHPGRYTLDQIFYLSQSISNGFNKPKPGSRTILFTIDFLKAFYSVWHPALFHKLISAGLPTCFARWTQSFLSDRRASVVF